MVETITTLLSQLPIYVCVCVCILPGFYILRIILYLCIYFIYYHLLYFSWTIKFFIFIYLNNGDLLYLGEGQEVWAIPASTKGLQLLSVLRVVPHGILGSKPVSAASKANTLTSCIISPVTFVVLSVLGGGS